MKGQRLKKMSSPLFHYTIVFVKCALATLLSLPMSKLALGQGIGGVGGEGAEQVGGGKTGTNQLMFGSTIMFFSNQATQGSEELPGGTTVYNQINIQYNFVEKFIGFGITSQQDKIGSAQQNTGLGIKGELLWNGYYAEIGFGAAQQKFTNRAVRTRDGTQLMYGGGIRVPFLYEYFYFDGGVRKRITTYSKQDGVNMHSNLVESLLMPFIGMGISL